MTARRPILVTGSHRSGTGWVAGMLAASQSPPLAYLWEPFNRLHRPGTFDALFPYWFPYICEENGGPYVDPVRDMLSFRYKPWAELRTVRAPKDAGRLSRDWMRFRRFRRLDAVPLLKDPIAVLSAEWLADTFDMDVVVLTRHPAAFAYSLKRRGWVHPFEDFLLQPLLMRDLLTPFESQIKEYASAPRALIDQASLLWSIVYSAVDQYRRRRPDWVFLRLEDVARDPVAAFAELFARVGLTFDGRVRTTILDQSGPSNPAEVASPSSVRRNSAASIGTWKTGLTGAEIDRVRAGVERVSKEFYADSDW
jgi:hypothetical protein